MSQFLASGGQNIGDSASILSTNIQGWFPLGLTSLISLLFKRLKESSPTPEFKRINSSVLSLLYDPTLTSVHDYLKNHSFDYMDPCRQCDISAFEYPKFVIAFLPRNKYLLISWLQLPSAMILEPKKIVCHCFHCFTIYLPWSDGTGCHDLRFLNAEF